MQFKEFNVKSILALFIIVFGMVIISFFHLEDMVLGAIIGFIGVPLNYFFGSSKSNPSTNIKDSTVYADAPDGPGGSNDPKPDPKDK